MLYLRKISTDVLISFGVHKCNHKKIWKVKNKQEYSDSRCQNLSSVILNISQATIKNAQNHSSCDKDTYTIANKVYRHIIFPSCKLDMCHKRLQYIWNFFWKSSQTRVSQSSYLKRFLLCCWCCYPLETNKFPIYIFHSNKSVAF